MDSIQTHSKKDKTNVSFFFESMQIYIHKWWLFVLLGFIYYNQITIIKMPLLAKQSVD